MKKIFSVILFFLFSSCAFSQTGGYNPWGIWERGLINEHSPVKHLSYGSYYFSRYDLSWIGISETSQGVITGEYNFPIFAEDGIFVRIERYEQVEDGYILYLIGPGIKISEGKPQFRENVRITLKMRFISENECIFQYHSMTDSDGFRFGFAAIENVIYRRYRVPE